jgi:hypothetical protein
MELNTKTKTIFYIGLSDEDMENQIFNPKEVIASITEIVEAGTFREGKGLWKGRRENTVIFECVDFEAHSMLTVEEFKESMENEFDQFQVTVERVEVETNL